MATEFVMPRLPDQQQYQQGPFQHAPISTGYQPSAPYTTPQISPLSTSGNASPTSPSKKFITRQIRPLYMPAVLRPTEFPSKAPSRPKTEEEDLAEEESLQPNRSLISLPSLGKLSRRSTGDSGKCFDGDWNLDLFPKPTGTPTRKHWKVCYGSALKCLTFLPLCSQLKTREARANMVYHIARPGFRRM